MALWHARVETPVVHTWIFVLQGAVHRSNLSGKMARVEFDQVLDNLVYTLGLWIRRSEFRTAYRTVMRLFFIRFPLLPVLGNSKEVFIW